MEREKTTKPKRAFLKSQIKENSFTSERRMTFKSAARKVWMANSFTKQHVGVGPSISAEENAKGKANELAAASVQARPPSVQRRGTPEIFPMSMEMKRTLVMLGNLDLVPEDERREEKSLGATEKRKKLSKFRQKTQLRVIQPQRFIRSIQSNERAKKSDVKEHTMIASKNIVPTTDVSALNRLTTRCQTNLFHTARGRSEKDIHDAIELETFTEEQEEDEQSVDIIHSRPDNKAPSNIISENSKSARNLWRKSVQKYQNQDHISSEKSLPMKKHSFPKRSRVHLACKTWQSSTDHSLKTMTAHKRRAFSLDSPRSLTSASEISEQLNDTEERTKAIHDITSDIQERCSKWFEFRQKIMKPNDVKL